MHPSLRLLAALAVGFAIAAVLFARPEPPAELDAEQLRAALLENPDIVVAAIEQHQLNEERARVAAIAERLEDYRPALERTASDPAIGPEDAAVTVVEFFDYECGFCKRVFPDLLALAAHESDVRIVFKEFPILADSSTAAAKAALAAHRQDKFLEYHSALMEYQGRKTETVLVRIAEELGLDLPRWEADRASEDVAAEIARNRDLGMELELGGTPAFIIGQEIVPGAVGLDQLKNFVAQARDQS